MSSDSTEYVSTLMFSPDLQFVAVIEKNRPKFLAGRLCPVGGHKEFGESAAESAAREHLEETGVATNPDQWVQYGTCKGPDWIMDCFMSVSPNVHQAATLTDEPVRVMRVADLLMLAATEPQKTAPDMIALVGLALQRLTRECIATIDHNIAPSPKLSQRPR